jgi:hypothetical protein
MQAIFIAATTKNRMVALFCETVRYIATNPRSSTYY